MELVGKDFLGKLSRASVEEKTDSKLRESL
jgi:hypothetical protein